MEIKQQLLTSTKNMYGKRNGKKLVVIHQTGNTSKGADAQAHANLQKNGNVRQAAWHIQADDKEVIQSFDYSFELWHAGDSNKPSGGNKNGIGIEICINSDGDYVKAVQNGAKATAKVLKDLKLPISAVKQHNNFSGKNCPEQIRAGRAGINWNAFIELVKRELAPSKTVSKPSTTGTYVVKRGDTLSAIAVDFKTTVQSLIDANKLKDANKIFVGQALKVSGLQNKPVVKKKFTKGHDLTSIVDFLKVNGVSSTIANRKKIAKENGITDYSGSASQNSKLIALLKKQ